MSHASLSLFADAACLPGFAAAAVTVANDDQAPLYPWARDAEDDAEHAPPPPIMRIALEDEVGRALSRRAHAAESAIERFGRMEREVASLFGRLSVADARLLRRRLRINAANDDLSRAFGAMVVDRRARLLRVLDEAPRRAALAACGRR